MKIKMQMITTMLLFLLAGNAFAQSIAVPTESVVAGSTATVVLSYTAGGGTDNFDFQMFYDETVIDEAALALGVVCDAAAIGITALNCSVNTTTNRVSGIGVNFGGPLTSGDFATVTLPTLPGAAIGNSVSNIDITFWAGAASTPADSTWTLNVTAAPLLDQTIGSFISTPSPLTYLGGDGTLSATATSGLPVAFAYTSGPCSVVGSTVSTSGAGVCAVEATQAGNGTYNPAPPVPLNITIDLADQVITGFASAPASGQIGDNTTLSVVSSGASGNSVIFTSTTGGICTVTGNTVTLNATGVCIVAANQAGNADFNPALQVTLNISVGLTDQLITAFTAAPAAGNAGGTSSLSATADSGLPVTAFGSNTPAICTVAGNTVTYVAVGTCTVTADQAGDGTYAPAPQVELDITVSIGDQTISGFNASPASGNIGGSSTLNATASSGLTVTFASNTPLICTVALNVVTYIAVGQCDLTANQAGDANYNVAPQVELIINVTDQPPLPPLGIPTLSATGLIAMFLLMLGLGGLVIRRTS